MSDGTRKVVPTPAPDDSQPIPAGRTKVSTEQQTHEETAYGGLAVPETTGKVKQAADQATQELLQENVGSTPQPSPPRTNGSNEQTKDNK